MLNSVLLSALLPLLFLAQGTAAAPQQASDPGSNGGDDNPPDPSDAGAAGASKGAFSLSTGALAAIIVVAVLVVVGGSEFISSLMGIICVLTISSSWICCSLLAREEAPMGCSPIDSPRLSSLYRSL